jgi:hypothetical protein
MEAQAIFLNSFTVCSSCKQKFVLCPLVDEEINGSYPLQMDLMDLPNYGHREQWWLIGSDTRL